MDISQLKANSTTNNLHVMLVRKLKLNNPKNIDKPIYKYLFVDVNNQVIQVTLFGNAMFEKYAESSVLSLTNFMVCPESKNAFWFKTNKANLYLLSNSICCIKLMESISSFPKQVMQINELEALDVKEKILISLQCVVVNVNQKQLGEKLNTKALAIDTKENISIDINIWGEEFILANNFVYNLFNVMLDPSQGYVISKLWCSTYEKLGNKDCEYYNTATCVNITTKTINGVKFESWTELEASTESMASISVMLMDVKLYTNKNSCSLSFKFQDSSNKIATATAWTSSSLEPAIVGIKLAEAEKSFQDMIGESFKIKVVVKRKRSLEDGTICYFSLLKIQK
jgi:hypothetical protein